MLGDHQRLLATEECSSLWPVHNYQCIKHSHSRIPEVPGSYHSVNDNKTKTRRSTTSTKSQQIGIMPQGEGYCSIKSWSERNGVGIYESPMQLQEIRAGESPAMDTYVQCMILRPSHSMSTSYWFNLARKIYLIPSIYHGCHFSQSSTLQEFMLEILR